MDSPLRAMSPVSNNDNSDVEEPLTPTSKVKAMLAAMEESEDDEDDIPVKPTRSRIARAMRVPNPLESSQHTGDSTVNDIVNNDEDEGLFVSPAPQRSKNISDQGSEDEEEDMPVRAIRSRTVKAMQAPTDTNNDYDSDPGLFVSPAPQRTKPYISGEVGNADNPDASEDDLPVNPANNRFLELVAKKRREREAFEAEQAAQRQQRAALEQEEYQSSADEGDAALTRSSRPTRRAGKKAIEEMARETQRMSRNMQLAHQAKTRKKIGKDSLFAKFNYKPTHVEVPHTPPKTASPRSSPVLIPETKLKERVKQSVSERLKERAIPIMSLDDSDSDLEILPDKIPAVFPIVKSKVVPTKKREMNQADLQISLQQRARAQAKRDREERLDMLRAKGVIVQTAEERQKEMADVEDMMAKARREGDEIMKREKEAAKKAAKETGEIDPLGDSSGDEDWEEDGDEENDSQGEDADQDDNMVEEEALELSGSEDEDDVDEENQGEEVDDDEEGDENLAPNVLEENEESQLQAIPDSLAPTSQIKSPIIPSLDAADESEDEVQHLPTRQRNNRTVLSDDEDQDGPVDTVTPIKTAPMFARKNMLNTNTSSPMAPPSVLRSAHKSFIPGLPIVGPAGLGLTQIFAGTMDESQSQACSETEVSTRPDSQLFDPLFLQHVMASQDRVPNSQPEEVSQGIQLDFSQSQIQGFESMMLPPTQYTESQFVAPTQDEGFQDHAPLNGRYTLPPPGTVETEKLHASGETAILSEIPSTSSPIKKPGRLQRGRTHRSPSSSPKKPTAFSVLGRKPPRLVVEDTFDPKTSEAKGLVNEQAEESEDEYAGLGGASDDESGGEEDAYVQEMINDEAGNDVDQATLAALFADRERETEAKAVEKLFKDITTGNLRRKRGGATDFDLDDSDDDGEARRRKKQREFARMRKALMADERVEKMAANPKSMAFLRSMEDVGGTGDGEGDEGPEAGEMEFLGKPTTAIEDIRQSLSQLVQEDSFVVREDEDVLMPWEQIEDPSVEDINNIDVEDVDETDENADNDNVLSSTDANRPHPPPSESIMSHRRTKVIDRITLKRESSSALSSMTRLAFASPSLTSQTSFKVPALLRRATTMSSMTDSLSGSQQMGSMASLTENANVTGVRKSTGRNSGIHRQSSRVEWERKKEEGERKRRERKYKGVGGRVGGLFKVGGFE